jgi:hypothetical protein
MIPPLYTLLILIAFGLTLWHGSKGVPPLWVALLLVILAIMLGLAR